MADVKQFVFFDFEMLCSNWGMPFTDMEAIRLGAVKYDLETEEITYFDRFIRPVHLRLLSQFCKKLTGIKDSDLVDADNFKQVFEDFLTWIGGVKRTRFFSWSKSDLTRLQLDAASHDISPSTIKKIEKRYIDFQAIFSKRISKDHFSVENALNLYGITFIGDKHNPMYDAYNTLLIYLCFSNQRLQSDLIMLKQFIFKEDVRDISKINLKLKKSLLNDVNLFIKELRDIYPLKDGKKMMKRTQKLVEKYENVLINRSGIFSEEIAIYIRLLVEFYHDLLASYDEHSTYSSKIMILNEQLMQQIKHLAITS